MDPSLHLYLGIVVLPFVQEDAAVITAATLSAHDSRHFPVVFFVILFGLFMSDAWKYWIGFSAHASSRARKFAEKDKVLALQQKVERNALLTLLSARFIPMARVPAYIACGYFKMNYLKFCAIIFLTALLYCAVIFAVIHQLGEAFGERMEIALAGLAGLVIVSVASTFAVKAMLRRRKSVGEDLQDS